MDRPTASVYVGVRGGCERLCAYLHVRTCAGREGGLEGERVIRGGNLGLRHKG